MIKMTLVDIHGVSSHEELSEIMLKHGGEGFRYAYRHEELEDDMILTDYQIDLDKYYEEMKDVGDEIHSLPKQGSMEYILSDGLKLILLKD